MIWEFGTRRGNPESNEVAPRKRFELYSAKCPWSPLAGEKLHEFSGIHARLQKRKQVNSFTETGDERQGGARA